MTQSEAATFAYLYQTFHRHVYAYCRRRVDADSVDDLVADVFLTVWRRIDSAPTGDAALGWLYRISYLVASNHWRGTSRRKKLTQKLELIGIQSVPLVQDQVVVREEVRDVIAAAQRLRSKDLEILRLSIWEQLSLGEIGLVLGINSNAAKQRLHRARNNLVRECGRTSQNAVTPAAQEGGVQ
jgi:RNA polymerase sigma-70 factor (ECF subfamily)